MPTQSIEKLEIVAIVEGKGRALNEVKGGNRKAQARIAKAKSAKRIKKIQKITTDLVSL
jgi:hypothetical protein